MKVLMIARSTLYSTPGGDTIQLKNTAHFLRKIGVAVDIKLNGDTIEYNSYDLLHFFNVIRPAGIINHVKLSKKPYVISTIFVDYSELEKQHRSFVYSVLNKILGKDGVEYLKVLARHFNGSEQLNSLEYIFKGQKQSILYLLKNAKCLLPNSENEYNRLLQSYRTEQNYRVIPNAIDLNLFSEELILPRNEREGIICVARFERIKNQLNIIKAVNKTDYKLTLIGKPAPNQIDYYKKCKSEAVANPNIIFIDHIKQEKLVQFYAKTKVHILASWFETTGLSSLEAGSMGCQLVITEKGDTQEYFKKEAHYCDPDSIISIQQAINIAMNTNENATISKRIRMDYIWEKTAKKTLAAYKSVLS